MADLNSLTKVQLEELGREHGIELDRRKTKAKLVSELREVVGDTNPPPAKPTLLTEVKPTLPSGKLLTEANGTVIIFDDFGSARGAGNKKGGKPIEFNGKWVVKIY
tara:strand:- start:799 stop:1116 length:318 start_codon:yes stop_codon:yes gene_type:complete